MRTSINESIIEYYTTTSLIIGSLEISKPLLFQALYQAFHCRRNYLLLLKKEHLETFHSFVIYGLTNILLTKKKKNQTQIPSKLPSTYYRHYISSRISRGYRHYISGRISWGSLTWPEPTTNNNIPSGWVSTSGV